MSENKGIYLGDWDTSVPNKIIKNPDLSIDARYFWTLIKSFMSPQKQVAFPSIQHLSKIADCTTNTVIKYLKELEKEKLLYRSKKVGAKTYYILSPDPMDIEQIEEQDEKLREEINSGGQFSNLNFSNMGNSNSNSSNRSSTHNKETPNKSNTIYSDNTKQKIKNIFNYWTNKDNTISHRKLTKPFKESINARLQDFSIDEIESAIDNYDKVLSSDKYYFTYDNWSIKDFLSRGQGEQLEKFLHGVDGFRKNEYEDKKSSSKGREPEYVN